ncbi:uncharacterized protein LOC124145791 [Haliotis rufescens]|uniref:uncharacterized protein LOC124145791 n=1 Tax=Haliotis rufescens TaxID=6454 RepID=UPI00201E9588|nr:uncharacterized protein LOC124145791 [Haliotis rufescens]
MTGTYKGHITVIVLVLMIWTVMEYAASNYWTRMDTNDFIAPAKYPGVDLSVSAESPRCPDVKTGMMRGRWRPRILTAQEKVDIGSFLKSARHRTPKPMQRSDGKCGNVAYENVYYIRALCNPAGPTPCCYGDTCINKTPDDCKCPNCYDLRTEIHAEYSTWEPEDSRCQVKKFTAQQACVLLKGLTITFVGNSFVRHVYTALLLLMTNYDINGAFIAGKPKDILCNGMYGFSDALCRKRLKRQVTLCGGSVTVKMLEYNRALLAAQFHKDFRSFLHKKKTMVLVGIGIHDHFNFESVFNEYMYPVIDMMRKNKASGPKMIWFSNHKFGILKSPKMPTQSNSRVAAFNKRMSEALGKYHIPIFDTYNLTSDVSSSDGAHFGMGVNVMKAQLLLNYLLEMKSKRYS